MVTAHPEIAKEMSGLLKKLKDPKGIRNNQVPAAL
jgi:hypothetical protein